MSDWPSNDSFFDEVMSIAANAPDRGGSAEREQVVEEQQLIAEMEVLAGTFSREAALGVLVHIVLADTTSTETRVAATEAYLKWSTS